MDKIQVKKRIEKLKTVISHHRYLYHVLDKQEISDSALDSLKHELYKLEQEHPDLITSDSPTQRIGGKAIKQFQKIKHNVLMLSIEDIFCEEELQDWENYLKRLLPNTSFDYFCEPKIDGFAISLIYRNKVLIQGSTRGDGKIGEDVTQNLKTIESIPLKLKTQDPPLTKLAQGRALSRLPKEVEIRGEVYMEKNDFDKFNEKRKEQDKDQFANPRNLAAGSIRQLDSKLAAQRPLKFLAYDIISDLGQAKHSEEHQILLSLGFKAELGKECANLQEIQNYWQEISNKRKNLAFQIDGIVININNNTVFKKLGIAGKSPRGARAFKFYPEQATTIIKGVKFQIGRTGAITPVALLGPVKIGGTIVSKATLHNEDEIKRLDARIGDTVIVERAGDVIPAVKKVLTELRIGKEKKIKMPSICPVCETSLIKPEKEIIWRCPNKNCFAIKREALEHFVSRKGFNIEGMGPKIINKLLQENLISNAADIFCLSKGDLSPLERFAEKSDTNLIQSIQSSKTIALSKFIFALGIRFVGEETAIDLARVFTSLEKISAASKQELSAIQDIGPRVSNSVYNWFRETSNQKLISDLLNAGITILMPEKISKKLSGQTFVLTGTLDAMTRDQTKEKIRFLGGEIPNTVSRKTNFLVAGREPGETKIKKAKQLGVKIINEKQFLEILKCK
jgi:DNA ligase (NAD+)